MSIDLPGHAAPAAGFEVPLAMLSACHGRIDKQGATLRALVLHVAARGADRPAQEAAAAVMRYFDSAAPHHHADEEQDLFPALLESMAGSDAVCLRELIAGLAAEHRALEAAWARARVALKTIVAGSTDALLAGADVETLVGLYQRHIAREEGELLPTAARLLDDATLDRIGRAMRARRGIDAI
jgi:hemerythrin-like domain-containing protein